VPQLQKYMYVQGRPKSKDCSGSLPSIILPNMNFLGQVIVILEQKTISMSRRFDPFLRRSRSHTPSTPRPFRTVWLHN